jgi:pepsin A
MREQSKLNVVFDTGSTNLWMASTLCTHGPCVQRDRKRYNMEKSETYDEPEDRRNLTITFATATLIGPTGVDQFHIGPFTVKNQTFGLIQEEKGPTFTELPLEGIVGLAFPSMARGGTAFFDNVIDQNVLRRNLFSFYLSPTHRHGGSSMLEGNGDANMRNEDYAPGMDAVLWGGIDKQLYEGELMWFPVTKAHYWSLDLFAFHVGNESMDLTEGRDNKGDSLSEIGDESKVKANLIVDSGTAYYTAEKHLYKKLMGRMSCNGRNPDLTYKLKDVEGNFVNLVVTPEDYMVAHCEPGYVKIPVPEKYGPALLLGELFMRKYFTVFDRGDGSDGDARIGLAKSRPGADVSNMGGEKRQENHENNENSNENHANNNDDKKDHHHDKHLIEKSGDEDYGTEEKHTEKKHHENKEHRDDGRRRNTKEHRSEGKSGKGEKSGGESDYS